MQLVQVRDSQCSKRNNFTELTHLIMLKYVKINKWFQKEKHIHGIFVNMIE